MRGDSERRGRTAADRSTAQPPRSSFDKPNNDWKGATDPSIKYRLDKKYKITEKRDGARFSRRDPTRPSNNRSRIPIGDRVSRLDFTPIPTNE